MIIGSFGSIIFEVSADGRTVTPQSMGRESKSRYAEHQVLGAAPRLEYLGPELSTVSMAISLRRDMGVTPEDELEALEYLQRNGSPQLLIVSGKNLGTYILDSLSQSFTRGGSGGFLAISLTLNFKEYL
ncbi:MAG: phage tail protein [Pseudomonadota bacterium]